MMILTPDKIRAILKFCAEEEVMGLTEVVMENMVEPLGFDLLVESLSDTYMEKLAQAMPDFGWEDWDEATGDEK